VLGGLAADLDVSVDTAGLAATAFGLSYAIGAVSFGTHPGDEAYLAGGLAALARDNGQRAQQPSAVMIAVSRELRTADCAQATASVGRA